MSIQTPLKTYQQMGAQRGQRGQGPQGGQGGQEGRRGTQGGYRQAPRPGSPTYTEAWALVEAARRMAGAIQSGALDEIETKRRIRDTLRLNWRLWTIFQSELTGGENKIPEEIRTNMLNLCQFVDKHTIAAIAETTAEKVAVLIDINRNIASGLLESLEEGKDITSSGITETITAIVSSESGSTQAEDQPAESVDQEA